jgi:single-strand DNA-binding protein
MYQNKVTLIGFLGNDAEVHTANDRSLTTFQVATKSSYQDKQSGEYVSRTEWHRCIVFGGLSKFAGTLTKGAHLQVEGELRSREYTPKKAAGSKSKKAETKQRIWEIRVASILKLDRAEKAAPEEQERDETGSEDIPF